MRGQKVIKKRQLEPDAIYNSVLVAKFINNIMRDGKKTTAQNVVYGAFERLSKKDVSANKDDSSKNDELKEKEVKQKIKENRWFLGLECEIGATEKQVDIQTAIDLHILTDFNQDKVFEFKSPNLQPFYRKSDTTRLYIKSELGEAMHQLIIYLRKTNLYSSSKEEGVYGIRGPSGYVVMGYKINQAQQDSLKDWNFHLRPHILLLTYDDVIVHAKRQLENIKSVRKVIPHV